MIDAREAKLVADNFHGNGYTQLEYNKTINRINKQVKSDAKNGKYKTVAYVEGPEALIKAIYNYYREYGYFLSCNYIKDPEGYKIEISWK